MQGRSVECPCTCDGGTRYVSECYDMIPSIDVVLEARMIIEFVK